MRKITIDLSPKSAAALKPVQPLVELASELGLMPVHGPGQEPWLEQCFSKRGLPTDRDDMYSAVRTVIKLCVEMCYGTGVVTSSVLLLPFCKKNRLFAWGANQ